MTTNGDLDPLESFRNQVKEALEAVLRAIGIDEEPVVLEKPPQGMGDLAFPCFQLAKRLRRNPADIAEDVASKTAAQGMIDSAEAKGGYVNFNVNSFAR